MATPTLRWPVSAAGSCSNATSDPLATSTRCAHHPLAGVANAARAVKAADPGRTTTTCLAGPDRLGAFMNNARSAVDALCVNCYGCSTTLFNRLVQAGYRGNFILGEFGVDGESLAGGGADAALAGQALSVGGTDSGADETRPHFTQPRSLHSSFAGWWEIAHSGNPAMPYESTSTQKAIATAAAYAGSIGEHIDALH